MFDKNMRVVILKKMKRIPKTGMVHFVADGNIRHFHPEFFGDDGYDAKSLDMWVLAVLLFELLTGHSLYEIPSLHDLSFQYFIWAGGLTNKKPNTPFLHEAPIFRHLSYLAKTFVSGMSDELKDLFENTLCVKPDSRWSMDQILDSPWMTADNKPLHKD
jgi:serine/threonine protein kinase